MRDGLSRTGVLSIVVLLVVSLASLLRWFAYFASDAAFLGRRGAPGGLWLTAALSGGVALCSGLLAFHYETGDYTRREEVLYRACAIGATGILLCSGIWAALVSVLG